MAKTGRTPAVIDWDAVGKLLGRRACAAFVEFVSIKRHGQTTN